MNDAKLKKLWELSRSEPAAAVPEGFAAQVLAATRRESRRSGISLWELLEQLFPKVAVATALIVGICILADTGFSAVTGSSLSTDVNEISEQWLYSGNN